MPYTQNDHYAEKMNAFMEKATEGQDVSHLASWYLQCIKRGDWEGITPASKKEYIEVLTKYSQVSETEEPHEETCNRHGQNMATKMCYGFDYMTRDIERIANAFERIADALEDKNK